MQIQPAETITKPLEEDTKNIFDSKISHVNKLEVLLAQPNLFEFLDKVNSCESPKQLVELFETEYTKIKKPTFGIEPKNESAARIRNAPIRRSSIDNEQNAFHEYATDTVRLSEQSKSIKGGQLKGYQLEGVSWLLSLYKKKLNGILADEMGLGKTIQTIAAMAEIEDQMTESQKMNRSSFHLVIVPKITLYNWQHELNNWLPTARVFMFYGNREEREKLKSKNLKGGQFDVIITTYDIVRKESYAMSKLKYDFMVIDEAHNIKNSKSVLSQVLRKLDSKHRFLLTGTPLQNNLQELWSLLNFIMPNIFDSAIDFNETFRIGTPDGGSGDAKTEEVVVQQIHRLLRPFMLRRIKAEVERSLPQKREMYLYFGLTKIQRKIYKNILKNHSHIVNGNGDRVQLLNILMQLKKVCNHPYLFDGVEPGPPFTNGEHLITNCMKFRVLDLLLPKLKAQNSRVLIFSQMSSLLDILDDYVRYRGYTYCRIDGQTSALDRELRIEDFQRPDSDKFIFLLTTRAGGCGINLHHANAVILYDSDWNPQVDLQAIDRAHRIGQTREVVVYRFVTEGTVEEKIIERASRRLKMESLVMQKGRFNNENKVGSNDIIKIIQFGAQKLIAKKDNENNGDLSEPEDEIMIEDQIERIIDYSQAKAEKLFKELSDLEHKYDLKTFSINSRHDHDMYVFDGENYYGKKKDEELLTDDKIEIIDFGTRERKPQNYDINKYYQKALNLPTQNKEKRKLIGWRQQAGGGYDHQFYNVEELDKLDEKEQAWKDYLERSKDDEKSNPETKKEEIKSEHSKDKNSENSKPIEITQNPDKPLEIKLKVPENIEKSTDKPESRQEDDKEKIVPPQYTEEDEKRKKDLLAEGYGNWSKKDFSYFIRGCEKHGRTAYDKISQEIGTKSIAEIEQYSKVFWEKVKDMPNGQRYIERITKGEAEINKIINYEEIIDTKFSNMQECMDIDKIEIDYGKAPLNQHHYTKEEDQFLAYCMYKYRYGTWELYRFEIENSQRFIFNWKFLMRTGTEIQRRCEYLIQCFKREIEKNKRKQAKLLAAANAPPKSKLKSKIKRKGHKITVEAVPAIVQKSENNGGRSLRSNKKVTIRLSNGIGNNHSTQNNSTSASHKKKPMKNGNANSKSKKKKIENIPSLSVKTRNGINNNKKLRNSDENQENSKISENLPDSENLQNSSLSPNQVEEEKFEGKAEILPKEQSEEQNFEDENYEDPEKEPESEESEEDEYKPRQGKHKKPTKKSGKRKKVK